MASINETIPEIEYRFQKAAASALTEAQKFKMAAIEYLIFDPGGKDLVEAAKGLSEIGF